MSTPVSEQIVVDDDHTIKVDLGLGEVLDEGLDLSNPIDRDHAQRIGRAWLELRRGGAATALRDYMYGRGTLEQGQIDALEYLVRRDRKMKGLADKLRIEPSSATRAVQRLVKDGLAERYASPEDGRVVMVRITEEGRRAQTEVAARRAFVMQRVLSAFRPGERAVLAELLDRFIVSVDDVVESLD
ncbi:MAG: MarR family transcriptional regulator [Acidimicrobiia bacterium]|nr:MarR family transcriptional regulator [Acidimicrobiia bacterium]